MRDDQDALFTDKDGTQSRHIRYQLHDFFGRTLARTVIPMHLDGVFGRIRSAGEDIEHLSLQTPEVIIRAWSFGADGNGSRQTQGLEDRVKDMATHIAKDTCSEILDFTPVARMIDFIHEGAL
ncbi:hypothetical protein SDC9_208480 [bioreactor metagenome]|uniref:Uncharacterized protein n=1 Tax=bioreactor metagenome TaxID=1076179 RepID=A0A645JAR3_9ZZZZ